jgi:hypothetical protein
MHQREDLCNIPEFRMLPMCEFSQKFKTFCLILCATKFWTKLLATHLKFHINQSHIKIIFRIWFNCELDLFGF